MTSPDLPLEAPVEDAIEQDRDAVPAPSGGTAVELPLEANEADAMEQARDDGPYDEEL